MKQLVLLFAFVLTAGMVSAQDAGVKKSCAKSCAKTCSKSKASASLDSETKVASALAAADLVAEKDGSIEKKVCDMTGSVSYYKKSVCEKSGSVKMTEVEFDADKNSFVNVSPKEMMAEKEGTAVKAASKSADASPKKKCCAGKKSCKKKGA